MIHYDINYDKLFNFINNTPHQWTDTQGCSAGLADAKLGSFIDITLFDTETWTLKCPLHKYRTEWLPYIHMICTHLGKGREPHGAAVFQLAVHINWHSALAKQSPWWTVGYTDWVLVKPRKKYFVKIQFKYWLHIRTYARTHAHTHTHTLHIQN